MKPSYTIETFLPAVLASHLAPHPEAKMPIDEQDKTAIQISMEETGIIQPLLVVADGKEKYLIIDGVNRFDRGVDSGRSTFPCLLVRAPDVRHVVYECLASHRKCSTGQRILAYIAQHKREVLEAHTEFSKKGNEFTKVSRETLADDPFLKYSAQSISDRLQCSRQDVLCGIELFKAMEGEHPKPVEEQFSRILSGSSPIRRWRAAVAGAANKGKERAEADYTRLLMNAATTLANGFKAWSDLNWKQYEPERPHFQEEVISRIRGMLDVAPDVIRYVIRNSIKDFWPAADKKKLLAEIKKAAK